MADRHDAFATLADVALYLRLRDGETSPRRHVAPPVEVAPEGRAAAEASLDAFADLLEPLARAAGGAVRLTTGDRRVWEARAHGGAAAVACWRAGDEAVNRVGPRLLRRIFPQAVRTPLRRGGRRA